MTETTFPDHPSTRGTALLPCAIAENAARGTALALAFARRGWDVGVYYDADGEDGGDGGGIGGTGETGGTSGTRDTGDTGGTGDTGDTGDTGVAFVTGAGRRETGCRATALALCAAVTALGRRAAAFPVSTQPSATFATSAASAASAKSATHAGMSAATQRARGSAEGAVSGPGYGAAAADHDASQVETLIQRCAQRLGRPRCVVSAPLRVERDADGRLSGPALARMNHANLWIALALAQTLSDAVAADRGNGSSNGSGSSNGDSDGNDADADDAVVVNIVDSLLPEVRRDAVLFALTQSAVANATPVLARRYAPRLRVVAVSTPLLAGHAADAGGADHGARAGHAAGGGPLDASLAQAVCYLAEASTITGSTLLVDGGMGCALPGPTDALEIVRHVTARERSRS
ncbi:MAG: hypothetical protein ACRYHA_23400 [Janthinobacterium lividum]